MKVAPGVSHGTCMSTTMLLVNNSQPSQLLEGSLIVLYLPEAQDKYQQNLPRPKLDLDADSRRRDSWEKKVQDLDELQPISPRSNHPLRPPGTEWARESLVDVQ